MLNARTKELFRFLIKYQKKYILLVIVAASILVINILLQLPMPLITKYLIDTIIPRKDFNSLNFMCFLLLIIIAIRQISSYYLNLLIIKYKAKVRRDIEKDFYLHIQNLPLSYFNRNSSGYIIARISEISSIESMTADTFLYILRDAITVVVGVILILSLHFRLGIISILVLPFFIFSLRFFHGKLKKASRELKEENAQYIGKIENNLAALEKIKASVLERIEGERVIRRLTRVINSGIISEKIANIANTITSSIGFISPFIVLWYGVYEIIQGKLTLGTFFAINSFLGYLYNPAKRLTETGYSLSQAMAGVERVYDLFNEPEEIMEGVEISSIDSIEFDKVNFSYNGKDMILCDFNLKIKRGERIALVGKSGEGKTTLIKMILGFCQPDSGKILISGVDSMAISKKSLRKRISYISQFQRLLEEDLYEKIKNEKVKNWLKKINFEKYIDNDLSIFQREFSGGEIQKLEIIDAILQDTDALIIDEGTSNIDFNVERVVLDILFEKFKNKIIVFIAHRLTSIVGFKRILVLSDGKIVEEGDHDQLMRNKYVYSNLWGGYNGPGFLDKKGCANKAYSSE